MCRYPLCALFILVFVVNAGMLMAQDVIDVSEQGISDGVRNSKQQDRDEAILDAKLKAIEKAGVSIQSITESQNFVLKTDWIESKAAAYLLPGFQIVDVGYGADSLYHVVLIGKVSAAGVKKESSDTETAAIKKSKYSIEWVLVKGGTFQMGDTFGDGEDNEKPVHNVTLSDFYIAKYEVTVAQYRAFCNATGRKMPDPPSWGWQDDCPVLVCWKDAKDFCAHYGYRLPTEAEWEFAARGGNQSQGFKYSGSDIVDEVAWYVDNSGEQAHSVGEKNPNELGLYDMSGNAMEWCSDNYQKNYYNVSPATNPQGADRNTKGKPTRGGSCKQNAWELRCTKRYVPMFANIYSGLRPVR